MSEYHILQGENRQGPYTLEELMDLEIFADTLIGRPGWERWKPAAEVPELQHLISKELPPIPPQVTRDPEPAERNTQEYGATTSHPDYADDLVPEHSKWDYSEVEDLAGVDYQKAMYVTGAYIAINLLFKEQAVLGFFGILISTTLVVIVWSYFRKYFVAVRDTATAKWIQAIIGAHLLFGVVNLFSLNFSSLFSIPGTGEAELAQNTGIITIGSLIAMLIVVISSIQLIRYSHKHPLPLKRIGISTMILVPLYMTVSLFENMPLLDEIAAMSGDDQFETGWFFNLLVMLPFLFLLQHFYRADKYDATPGV